MNKLKKDVDAASAGRMDYKENNESGLSLLSGEAVFHDAHNYEYKMYKVVRGNKTILKTVLTAKKGEWTEAEKAAIDNLNQLLALPKSMCKVVLKDPLDNIGFVIYNHLFSKTSYKFTINQLVDELRQYHLYLSQEMVQREIDGFVKAGLLYQNFRSYSTCGR